MLEHCRTKWKLAVAAVVLALPIWAEGVEPSPPVVSAPAPAPAADAAPEAMTPMSLRPRFVAGHKSRYEIWTLRSTHNAVSGGGRAQQVDTSLEVTGEMQWEVERVGNDGSATCVMTVDWLAATLVLEDGSKVEVDSRRPARAGADGDNAEARLGQMMRAITAVPMKVKMSADGTALNVTGVEAVRRKAGNGPKPPDEIDFLETASDLATVVGAPTVSALNGPGAKWDASFSWNHEVGKLQQQMTYTLAGTEEIAGIPVATVVGSAKVKLVPDVAKLQLPAGSPKPDIRFTGGSADTQIMFDLSRGEAIGRNTLQRVDIEVRAKVGNVQMIRNIDETVQSQALRIWEN
jgi:hypothetical protein